MEKIAQLAPVVKWVGGKRQLWKVIEKFVPRDYSTYYEPFVGGGAVWLRLQPSQAVINDRSAELINVYEVIRDDVDSLLAELRQYKNEKAYFYKIRAMDRNPSLYENMGSVQRAARLLYLNKTCYNGLFRVNQQGQFNVPFGAYKNPNIVNEAALRALNQYLNTAAVQLLNGDFAAALAGIQNDAFVYFDPPYDPVSPSANFTGYSRSGFDRKEQERLRMLCDKLHGQGVKFLLSNSATKFILDLFKAYRIERVRANRAVNSRASARGAVDELLVMNYDA